MLNTPLVDLPCAPSALTNAPIALAEHASNFSCFNPSVLPPVAERAAGSRLVVATLAPHRHKVWRSNAVKDVSDPRGGVYIERLGFAMWVDRRRKKLVQLRVLHSPCQLHVEGDL